MAKDEAPGRFSLTTLQKEYAGCWVALRGTTVIEANSNPYDLVAQLRRRRITDTTILRVPDVDELETVGIG
jgi:hypothetical protein